MTYKGFGFAFGPEEWMWMCGTPRGGRRRRRVRWFESGDMKYVILRLLKDKPMHGYEVMKALGEETNGCYSPSPGTVYPTLQWLEDEGLVEVSEVEGKKVYSITDEGLEFLDEHRSTVDDIFDRIGETIESLFADPMPEVTRLVSALVGRAYRDTFRYKGDDELQQKIVDILKKALDDLDGLTRSPA